MFNFRIRNGEEARFKVYRLMSAFKRGFSQSLLRIRVQVGPEGMELLRYLNFEHTRCSHSKLQLNAVRNGNVSRTLHP